MKLPRDLSGAELAKALQKVGYRITRQTGSHIRLTCDVPQQHHVYASIRRGLQQAIRHQKGRHVAGMRFYVRSEGERKRLQVMVGCGNVFRDLGFDKIEAENLKLRSQLMMRIEESCRSRGMTRAEAARVLGLTRPRLNALLKGKIGLFSLDALVNCATRAGLNVRLVVKKAA